MVDGGSDSVMINNDDDSNDDDVIRCLWINCYTNEISD